MGEPEQLLAEPDEVDEEEPVEGVHPSNLQQSPPRIISHITDQVTSFFIANGWFVLGTLILCYIAWVRFEPKIKSWLRKREEENEAVEHQKNPDALLAKHRAIDEARRRMQEQYNMAAAISLEKKLEMEEKKREEKIKKWEDTQPSGGRVLGPAESSGASASSSSTTASNAKGKSAAKARLRPEYNPLTGDTGASSSCRWRPSTQRPSGGG